MFWYIAHVKNGNTKKLVTALNRQNDLEAFIPKKEKWFGRGKVKNTYIIQELYPDYVFIKSILNKDEFSNLFKEFFHTIDGLIELLDYEDVYPLNQDEQVILEKLFNNEHVIRCTEGESINSRFVAISGPLKGLEDKIVKVNRHNRFALLDCGIFAGKFTVPVNVVRKA